MSDETLEKYTQKIERRAEFYLRLMWVGVAIALIGLVLELLKIVREEGVVITSMGILITLIFGIQSLTLGLHSHGEILRSIDKKTTAVCDAVHSEGGKNTDRIVNLLTEIRDALRGGAG